MSAVSGLEKMPVPELALFGNGLCKRIIPCLDVAAGRTVKGIKFGNLRDVGNPVELALTYEQQGADELTFLDISASVEKRSIMIEVVRQVAAELSIPFTVGGGITTLDDVKRLLDSGADKVSINTAAVANPALIDAIAGSSGSQCCVVAIDARALPGQVNAWEVLVKGGRVPTGMDALVWARQCVDRGAGEILLTSWDRDGTLSGFDIELVRTFAAALPVPVIASGGASSPDSFTQVFEQGQADAALAASIFHDRTWSIAQVKQVLRDAGVNVRL